jgi:predicted transcriptional regulator
MRLTQKKHTYIQVSKYLLNTIRRSVLSVFICFIPKGKLQIKFLERKVPHQSILPDSASPYRSSPSRLSRLRLS